MSSAEMLDVLALTDALIEAGWCQGLQSNNFVSGEGGSPFDVYPTRHCVVGALHEAMNEVEGRGHPRMKRFEIEIFVAEELAARWAGSLVSFNDHPMTRKRQVQRLIRRAAAAVGNK